mmetsp:Transcript_21519/g.33003  ORF Transcript_21519/g.33003 Transcript_21519/m.33003 type:complete len:294 (+) Transcript_21519:107-988(+)
MIFDPGRAEEIAQKQELRRRAFERLRVWSEEIINDRAILVVNVQELACDDPECAPVDTIIELMSKKNEEIYYCLRFAKVALDIQQTELVAKFPDEGILNSWHSGIDVEWPKAKPPPTNIEFKFKPGDHVMAWLGGQWRECIVDSLWYRNKRWPKSDWMPYRLRLLCNNSMTYAPCEAYLKSKEENTTYPQEESPHEPAWRFNVGDRVECKMADGWHTGIICFRNIPDPQFFNSSFSPLENNKYALIPYIVNIENSGGRRIVVPCDHESVVRSTTNEESDHDQLLIPPPILLEG